MKNSKLLNVVGIILLCLFIISFLISENGFASWAILFLSFCAYFIFINKSKQIRRCKKLFLVLMILITNIIGFHFANKISFTGAMVSKVLMPMMQKDMERPLIAENDEMFLVNEKNFKAEWKSSKDHIREFVDLKMFQIETLVYKNGTPDKVILQLHGGGFACGVSNIYRDTAKRYFDIDKNIMVVTPNYRTASQAIYPAALMDCVETYKWILEQGYDGKEIIVVGDSAGGSLALSLIHYLKDNNIEIPKGVITWSPVTDYHLNTESCEKNADVDPVLGNYMGNHRFNPDTFKYLENAEYNLNDPYLSPIYGDFSGFPDMLLQVGSREILLDDTLLLAQKARESGVQVTQTTYYGMVHVFQLVPVFPEGKNAWKEMKEFINNLWR